MKRALKTATTLTAILLIAGLMACSDSSGSSNKNSSSDSGITNLSDIDTQEDTSLDIPETELPDLPDTDEEINDPDPDIDDTTDSTDSASDTNDESNSDETATSNDTDNDSSDETDNDTSDNSDTDSTDNADPEILEISLFYFSADDNISLETDFSAVIAENSIIVTLPENADLASLVPRFEYTGSYISVNDIIQLSGYSRLDFTDPVQYIIEGENESVTYDVIVAVDTQPVIIAPESSTLTADTALTIDVYDDKGIIDNSVFINGKAYTIPAELFIDIDAYQPGELSLTISATDTFGQKTTLTRIYTITRETILDESVAIGPAVSIADPLSEPSSWLSTGLLNITENGNGEIMLSAENPSSIMHMNASLQNMIVEADIKLISGNEYNLAVRTEDNGTDLVDGYAFNFNPGLADVDSGIQLSYLPVNTAMSTVTPYAGIESLTGWHRISFAVLTDPDDGLTYLEAYIGLYEYPESGTGSLNYTKVLSVVVNELSSHKNKPWNRIKTTDLLSGTTYQSAWDESIDTLYQSGSFALYSLKLAVRSQ